MGKTYDEVYDEYFIKYRDSSLGDELRYNKDVVATVIDLLKNLKNKLCVNEGNVKSEISAKFKAITGMKAINNKSNNSTFNVMDDSYIEASVTKKDINEMPGNIETLLGDLIKTLEDESQIMNDYLTRKNTAEHIEEYRKFLSEHSEKDYDPVKIKVNYNGSIGSDYNLSEGIELQNYKNIQKYVEDYDNMVALTNLKNSKLLNKAINKKVAFSNAGENKPKNRKAVSYSASNSYVAPNVNNKVFSNNETQTTKTETANNEAKVNDVKPVETSNQLKSNTTTKTADKQSSNNIKSDMTKSSSTKNTTGSQKSSIVNGITSTIKNAIDGKNTSAMGTSISKATLNSNSDKNLAGKMGKEAEKIGKEITGKLSSSVNSLAKEKIKPIVNLSRSVMNEDLKPTAGKFIPPIAGVSAAVVAGVGTKIYEDKKDNKKDDKKQDDKGDEKNKFINYDIEEEQAPNPLSREDLLKMLDR